MLKGIHGYNAQPTMYLTLLDPRLLERYIVGAFFDRRLLLKDTLHIAVYQEQCNVSTTRST